MHGTPPGTRRYCYYNQYSSSLGAYHQIPYGTIHPVVQVGLVRQLSSKDHVPRQGMCPVPGNSEWCHLEINIAKRAPEMVRKDLYQRAS